MSFYILSRGEWQLLCVDAAGYLNNSDGSSTIAVATATTGVVRRTAVLTVGT